jgi:hypothetical protein
LRITSGTVSMVLDQVQELLDFVEVSIITEVGSSGAVGFGEELEEIGVVLSGDGVGGIGGSDNGISVPGGDSIEGVAMDEDVHASEGRSDRSELARDLELGGNAVLDLTEKSHGFRDIVFVSVHEKLVGVRFASEGGGMDSNA